MFVQSGVGSNARPNSRSRVCRVSAVVLGALLTAAPAMARDIYKWVDEQGATFYGESAPVDDMASLEVLQLIGPTEAPVAAPGDYRSVLEMAESLQADRLARERLRLERDKFRLQQREAASRNREPVAAQTSEAYLFPYSSDARRPYRHRPYPRRPYHDKDPAYPPDVPIRAYPGGRP